MAKMSLGIRIGVRGSYVRLISVSIQRILSVQGLQGPQHVDSIVHSYGYIVRVDIIAKAKKISKALIPSERLPRYHGLDVRSLNHVAGRPVSHYCSMPHAMLAS